MARRVEERPFLPQAVPRTFHGVVRFTEELIRQLVNIFGQYGFRLNAVLPKDGSEVMTKPLPLRQYADADLPDPTEWEGAAVYGTDAQVILYSDGTAWRHPSEKSYPIGSLYLNVTDDTDPATLLGFGSWTKVAEGRVILGDDGATYTAGDTGGSLGHKHISPTNEDGGTGSSGFRHATVSKATSTPWPWGAVDISSELSLTSDTETTGHNAVIENDVTFLYTSETETLPPHLVAHIWQRTA